MTTENTECSHPIMGRCHASPTVLTAGFKSHGVHAFRCALLAVSLALPVIPLPSLAQAYPSRSVKIIQPYAVGGPSDLTAREIANGLSQAMGKPFIVESKAGASGAIGMAYVINAPPDGYTLLLNAGPTLAAPQMPSGKPAFDGVKEWAPIALVQTTPNIMVVGAHVKATNLAELIEWGKNRPKGVNYGSPGAGGPQQMASALFAKESKIPMTHVPYNGAAPMLNDIIAGHIDFGMLNVAAALPHMRSGQLRAVAMGSKIRSAAAPDVPTFIEQGVQITSISWQGLLAPAGTPPEIVNKLAVEVAKYLAKPEVKARMEGGGREVQFLPPEQMHAWLQDNKRLLEAAKAAGVLAEPQK